MSDNIEDLLTSYLGTGSFQKFLGMEFQSCDPEKGEIVIRLPYKPDFERGPDPKQWHGGPLAAFIDIVGDFALIAMLGRGIPTINLRIDYLRPAIDTDLVGTGRVLRAGRSVGVVDVELTDDKGRTVAVGRGSYSTLPPA